MVKIDCAALAKGILDKIKEQPKNNRELCIISVGHDPASEAYLRGKKKDLYYSGIPYSHVAIEDDGMAYIRLEQAIRLANEDPDTCGIILQLPLPAQLKEDEKKFTNMILPQKDVDGFVQGSFFKPCTPEAITWLMKKELGDDLSGKRALIVGRGKLVGKPLYDMLQYQENMSVMQVGSSEDRLDELIMGLEWSHWDAIITATGKPGLINLGDIYDGLVIDAGIARGEDGKLCGDCCGFEDGYGKARVTPVPGGIGLLTRAFLVLHAWSAQQINL